MRKGGGDSAGACVGRGELSRIEKRHLSVHTYSKADIIVTLLRHL